MEGVSVNNGRRVNVEAHFREAAHEKSEPRVLEDIRALVAVAGREEEDGDDDDT